MFIGAKGAFRKVLESIIKNGYLKVVQRGPLNPPLPPSYFEEKILFNTSLYFTPTVSFEDQFRGLKLSVINAGKKRALFSRCLSVNFRFNYSYISEILKTKFFSVFSEAVFNYFHYTLDKTDNFPLFIDFLCRQKNMIGGNFNSTSPFNFFCCI